MYVKKILSFFIIGLTILVSEACTTPEATQTISPPISATTAPPSLNIISTATPIDVSSALMPTPTSSPSNTLYGIEIPSGYEIEQIIRPALLMPCDVKVSPDGRIFFAEWEGNRILELGQDGEISVAFELEKFFNNLLIDSLGNFFVMQGDELVKITPSGERSVFTKTNAPGGWAFDSQDNLFMIVAGELLRYSPDGEKTIIITGVENGDMAISPSGDIYFASGSSGKIFKVTLDGSIRTLTDGFAHDAFNIAFDNQGNLYQNANYFTQVSLEDGSLSPPLLRSYNVVLVSRPFAFTPSGEAIFIGPTSNNAFEASIQNETVSVLVEGVGNSHALAIDSSGNLFMGASNEFPLATGRLLKISPDGSTTTFATGLFTIRDVILDNAGNLYISDIDNEGQGGGRLIRITPSGETTLILQGHYDLSSMVYVPTAGAIWAFQQHNSEILSISLQGEVTTLPLDFGGLARSIDLALDENGKVIALVVFDENYNIGPVHRELFRISPDGQISYLVDIDSPLATSEDDVYVSPTGDIYVIGPEEHPIFRMLKVTPEGEVSVFAKHLPYDTLSLVVSDAGDIYFTCSAGLFKISQTE